MNLEEG